jgi:hypothetical protein
LFVSTYKIYGHINRKWSSRFSFFQPFNVQSCREESHLSEIRPASHSFWRNEKVSNESMVHNCHEEPHLTKAGPHKIKPKCLRQSDSRYLYVFTPCMHTKTSSLSLGQTHLSRGQTKCPLDKHSCPGDKCFSVSHQSYTTMRRDDRRRVA